MSFAQETILASREVDVERKHYLVEVRENARGRFLKIVEEAHGRRNCVIVPSTGLNEFVEALQYVVQTASSAAV